MRNNYKTLNERINQISNKIKIEYSGHGFNQEFISILVQINDLRYDIISLYDNLQESEIKKLCGKLSLVDQFYEGLITKLRTEDLGDLLKEWRGRLGKREKNSP